ncbi:MAG TPA: LytTR family DNA-binding domain-containing protein [Phnomibacter sp.]|nr:LytTR family DNA-binding domain-containing protein [Phnomibacter sp.]
MYKAVLVDDELHCTEMLAYLLQAHFADSITITARFNQPQEALRYLLANKVDLLFLDIEMPGMNGFELLSKLLPLQMDVVFVTAYDQYAIKAFSYSAISYLLKPVDDEDLVQVLNRWLQKQQKHISLQQVALMKEMLDNVHKTKTRVALPTGDGLEFLEIASIMRCESDNNYTRIFCADKTHHLICRTLKDVEKVLGENGFIRVHQSHLINPQYIKKLLRNDGGSLIMTDGAEIAISRTKKDRLYELLSGVEKL